MQAAVEFIGQHIVHQLMLLYARQAGKAGAGDCQREMRFRTSMYVPRVRMAHVAQLQHCRLQGRC